jgi:hypothetical protein
MTKQRFGDRATFAVEVGEIEPPQMGVVELWADGTDGPDGVRE